MPIAECMLVAQKRADITTMTTIQSNDFGKDKLNAVLRNKTKWEKTQEVICLMELKKKNKERLTNSWQARIQFKDGYGKHKAQL